MRKYPPSKWTKANLILKSNFHTGYNINMIKYKHVLVRNTGGLYLYVQVWTVKFPR